MLKKRNRIFLSMLLSIMASLNFVKGSFLYNGLNVNSVTNTITEVFNSSIIYFFILSIAIFYLLSNVDKDEDNNLLSKLFNGLYAIILVIFCIYGEIFRSNGVPFSKLNIIIFGIKVLSCSVIAYLVIKFLEYELIQFFSRISISAKGIHTQKQITWIGYFLFIIVCWIPYLYILYPGINNPDTTNQLLEFFNHGNWVRDDYPIAWYIVGRHPFTITNQHNFFVTILYGSNVKLGWALFHNAALGLFFNVLVQALLITAVYTYALVVFNNYGMSLKNIKRFAIFFALFPMFPVTTMFLTKNVLYSGFLMLAILLVADAFNDEKLFKKFSWNFWFCISIFGQLLTQKYAIYVIIIFAMLVLIFLRTNRRYLTIITEIFLLLVIFIGGQNILFKTLNVPRGDPIEGQAIVIQSTALYQKKFPNDMNNSEKKVINKVFVRKNLAHLYNPLISDPIKSSGGKKVGLKPNGKFNSHIIKGYKEGYRYQTVTKSDIKSFKKVWKNLMLRHPDILIQAFMNNSYQYIDITSTPTNSVASIPSDSFNLAHTDIEFPLKNNKQWIRINYTNRMLKIRKFMAIIYNLFSKIPPLMLIINGNLIIMMTIIFEAILLKLKLYNKFLLFIMMIIQVPIYMLSPVNGSQRYMYPFILSVGVIIGLTVCWVSKFIMTKKGE